MSKKIYWVKLKTEWFRSKAIKKLRRMAGGDTCTIIYLKMLLLSANQNGKLCFEHIEDDFCAELALELDENEADVENTVAFLQRHGLLETTELDEFALPELSDMIGGESASAERVRKHRQLKKEEQKALQCNTDVTGGNAVETSCNTDIDIDKEKDIDNIIYSCPEQNSGPEEKPDPPVITLTLNTGDEFPICQKQVDEFRKLYPAVNVDQELRNMRGWLIANKAKRKTKSGIMRFVNSWLAKEQNAGGSHAANRQQSYTAKAASGKKPGFANFNQRENDYEELQKQLVLKSMEGTT